VNCSRSVALVPFVFVFVAAVIWYPFVGVVVTACLSGCV